MGYETEDLNLGRSWALWNFEGYEVRTGDSTGGGWEELVDLDCLKYLDKELAQV